MAWTWRYEDADGRSPSCPPRARPRPSPSPASPTPSRWIGETWRELLEAGVHQVVLLDGDRRGLRARWAWTRPESAAPGAVGSSRPRSRARGRPGASRRPRPHVAAGTVRTVEAYGAAPAAAGRVVAAAGRGRAAAPRCRPSLLVHGGYWQPGYDRGARGRGRRRPRRPRLLVWNVDYAAADGPGPRRCSRRRRRTTTSSAARCAAGSTRPAPPSSGTPPAATSRCGWRPAAALPPGAPGRRPDRAGARRSPSARHPSPRCVERRGGRPRRRGGRPAARGAAERAPDRYRVTDPLALAADRGAHRAAAQRGRRAGAVRAERRRTSARPPLPATTPSWSTVPGDHFAHLDPGSQAVAQLHRALAPLQVP